MSGPLKILGGFDKLGSASKSKSRTKKRRSKKQKPVTGGKKGTKRRSMSRTGKKK
jgi:hypothetical protein